MPEQGKALETIIVECSERCKRAGIDADVALWYRGESDTWDVSISNPSQHVDLGEITGRYNGTGKTALEAIDYAIKQMNDAA